MSRTLAEIADLYKQSRTASDPMVSRMREIRDAYNGDFVLPMPELGRAERSMVPNLLALGIDQNARRIASTTPDVDCPPDKPGVTLREKQAEDRRKVIFGWWGANTMRKKMYRRARWLLAYTASPVVLRPDFKRQIPVWQLRDPLTTYPAPSLDPDEAEPADCIFTFERSHQWLAQRYPAALAQFNMRDVTPNTRFEMIEYVDDTEWVVGIIGKKQPAFGPTDQQPNGVDHQVEVERIPNRTGVCPAVVPGRITLDRAQGQFDAILGMYLTQSQLMALELIAVRQGVFPEKWFVRDPNAQGNAGIIVQADGMTGRIGEAEGGKLEVIHTDPALTTLQSIDRMERAQRVTAGIPAEFGGESTTSVRTGKRGDAILSATVDFPVQEAQETMALSMEAENRRGIAIDKAYFGDVPKSFYVHFGKFHTQVDYTPSKLWTSEENYVSYSHAGADVNGLVISGGERIGMGTMSKRGFMQIDPMIDDPDQTHDEIIAEGLEAAMLQSVQQQAATGQIPPHFVARISTLVLSGTTDLADAIDRVHKEAQAAQAQQVPPGAPEAQPGIAQPGAGAEASIGPPGQSQTNLADLLNSLRRPQRTIPSEQGTGGPAPAPPQLAMTPGGGQ